MNLQEIASASALIKQELAPLAGKIGEGAEYTFGLFVKQVYVNALTDLLWMPVGVVFLTAYYKWFRHLPKINGYDRENHILVLAVSGAFLIPVAIAMLLTPISGLIQAVVNPEFQAIKLIIQTVKGSQ